MRSWQLMPSKKVVTSCKVIVSNRLKSMNSGFDLKISKNSSMQTTDVDKKWYEQNAWHQMFPRWHKHPQGDTCCKGTQTSNGGISVEFVSKLGRLFLPTIINIWQLYISIYFLLKSTSYFLLKELIPFTDGPYWAVCQVTGGGWRWSSWSQLPSGLSTQHREADDPYICQVGICDKTFWKETKKPLTVRLRTHVYRLRRELWVENMMGCCVHGRQVRDRC